MITWMLFGGTIIVAGITYSSSNDNIRLRTSWHQIIRREKTLLSLRIFHKHRYLRDNYSLRSMDEYIKKSYQYENQWLNELLLLLVSWMLRFTLDRSLSHKFSQDQAQISWIVPYHKYSKQALLKMIQVIIFHYNAINMLLWQASTDAT